MEFHKGASVHSADGEQVGDVDRVVIDPQSREVTHLVVEKGWLFTTNKLIPAEAVSETTEQRVTLKRTSDELENLLDFEETHYMPTEGEELGVQQPPGQTRAMYWYPPAGTTWQGHSGYVGYPDLGYVKPDYVKHTVRNIPEGTVPLKEGARVISGEGQHVGDVEEVLTDPEGDYVTHLVVSRGLLLKEKKLVPATWVTSVMEEEVQLAVGRRLLDELPEYQS